MKYFIMICAIPAALLSAPFKEGNFRLMKEIKVSSEDSAEFMKIRLDEEILRNSYYSDIRAVHDGVSLPYVRRSVQELKGRRGSIVPRIIHSKNDPKENKSVYILRADDLPEGSYIRAVKLRSDTDFETTLSVSAGENTKNLQSILDYHAVSFFAAETANYPEIPLHTSEKTLRIELNSPKNFYFTEILYDRQSTDSVKKIQIDKKELQTEEDSDTNSTVIRFQNKEKKVYTGIYLEFEETDFSREMTVFGMNEKKEYQSVYSGRFYSESRKREVFLILNSVQHSALKIEIRNQDSLPLHLKKLELERPEEEIVLKVSGLKDPGSIRIYYGNPYIEPIKTDLSLSLPEVSNDQAKFLSAELSKETENPKFSYSVLEPPVSSWIIRVLFYLGLAAFAFPAYRIFRKLAEKETH
ncbi:MAG TPA: hypothetical protein PKN56_15000 [Leptospiraceae bacterium]|nr:hypothetical protein [Leptospiraceae bacterium]